MEATVTELEPTRSGSTSLTDSDFASTDGDDFALVQLVTSESIERFAQIMTEAPTEVWRIRLPTTSLTDSDFASAQSPKIGNIKPCLLIECVERFAAFRKLAPRAELLNRLNQPPAYSETTVDYDDLSKQKIFEAVRDLYLRGSPRNRQIADRLIALHRDALSEGERIDPESISQFTDFFLRNRDTGVPKITLTPDSTLRVRWLHGAGNFIAIEFTGKALVKVAAEIPREAEPARYFFSESLDKVASVGLAIGASFA